MCVCLGGGCVCERGRGGEMKRSGRNKWNDSTVFLTNCEVVVFV